MVNDAASVGTACHKLLESVLKNGWVESDLRARIGKTVTVVVEPGEHATLAPSAAARWSVCPGSVVLESKVAESASFSYEVAITDEMVDWVLVVNAWVQDYLLDNPGCTLYSEERTKSGVVFGCPDEMWGTTDVAIVNRRRSELVVLDAKFGFHEVAVERNPQLLLYAIGLGRDFGWSFKHYRIVIAQPRSNEPIKQELLNDNQLQEEVERLRPKVEAALENLYGPADRLTLIPSKAGCDWCDAAGACPELQKRSLALAKAEFSEPALLPRDKLAIILSEAERIRSALNAAEQHAMKLLSLGQEVPGWKRVAAKKHRAWRDEKQAETALVKLGIKEPWTKKLITPAQAEKKLGRNSTAIEFLSERPEGDPTLVPDTDPRAAVAPDFSPALELEP